MKDFYGTEVKLRDEVICTLKNYRSLVKAEVIKITDKTVVVEYQDRIYNSKQTYRLTSDQFIIVGGGGE